MFVEGLLPTLTCAVAGSESLAEMSLKVCSFWNEKTEGLEISAGRKGTIDGRVVE